MSILSFYEPMVKSVAATFTTSRENKEEMIQEGLLKLFKIQQKHPEYIQDTGSEDCRRRAYVIVKNCMIDYVRKIVRQNNNIVDLDGDLKKLDKVKRVLPDFVSKLAIEKGIQELNEFLPYLEVRIFYEIVSPSDDFVQFLREKTAIKNIHKRVLKKNFRRLDQDDLAVASFLRISEDRYKIAMERIKNFVSRYPTIFKYS